MSELAVDQEAELKEEVTEEQASAQERFAELLADKTEDKTLPTEQSVDADEEVSEEPETEETQQEEPKETAKVEGPSRAMRWQAKQAGVSDRLIALADTDEDLEVLIEESQQSREPEKKAEAQEFPSFEIELPEDEFPADDPVRKQLVSMKGFYDKQLQQAREDIGLLASVLTEQKSFIEQSQQEQLVNTQGAFDAHLDQFENPQLGSRAAGNHNHKLRQAIYNEYWELKQDKPNAKDADLINEAVAAFGIKSQQTKRKEALEHDNKRRLGGGPTKAVSEPQLTGRALAESRIQEILARSNK